MQRSFIASCGASLAVVLTLVVSFRLNQAASAGEAASLRLIPFPKEITLQPGEFGLGRPLVLEVSQEKTRLAAEQIAAEMKLAGVNPPPIQVREEAGPVLRLFALGVSRVSALPLRQNATAEDYSLQVQPEMVVIGASELSGLLHGAQTLRQLIRANRQGDRLPCLTIRDGPSLRWRAFQDDLTRGPSSTLAELKREAALGAFFKQNIFTYYMEHQYAFSKHPVIGPKDGSLTPVELAALVSYSEPLQLNILGNQQSFGHFGGILGHADYAALRETPDVLCPTNARTYQLLDDLYSEVAPLLPFPFFNVCCDETDGLGQGPSKPVAEKIGVGGLYVQHIQRIHDLVKNKYHKRMMMWGDIILRHPQNLEAIPKDTIMLSWGYDPRGSFEDQITPFAKSGYEFFVCPGVNCWNRVLPHFRDATINIRNFVRDGIKHGALGMLNTAWDDDGETFNAPNWHGIAWGAECSWNASATAPEDFNRRIGAVLFGEKGDHFGKAIELLSTPEICGLPDGEFWKFDFGPGKASNTAAAQERWNKRLPPIRAAIEALESCRRDASTNAELLDYFLFGARRMEFCAQRELDRLEAATAYRQAAGAAPEQAEQAVARPEAILRRGRDVVEALSKRFAELWSRENKPYAMDRALGRYQRLMGKYDTVLNKLASARLQAKAGQPLPPAAEIGLALE